MDHKREKEMDCVFIAESVAELAATVTLTRRK